MNVENLRKFRLVKKLGSLLILLFLLPSVSHAHDNGFHCQESLSDIESWAKLIEPNYHKYFIELNSKGEPRAAGARERLEPGSESHGHWLREIGFVKDPSLGTLLLAPDSGSFLLLKAQELINRRAQQAGVKSSDVMKISLGFGEPKSSSPDNSEFDNIMGFVPFVDDYSQIPKGHKLVSKMKTFAQVDWAKWLGRRRLIISFRYLKHELGHITEYMEWPGLMKVDADFYTQMTKLKNPLEWAEGSLTFKRVQILRELFALPDTRAREVWSTLLPAPFRLTKRTTRELKNDWENFPEEYKLRVCESISYLNPNLIFRIGGAIRDGYHFDDYVSEKWRNSLRGDSVPIDIGKFLMGRNNLDNFSGQMRRANLLGIKEMIAAVFDVLDDGRPYTFTENGKTISVSRSDAARILKPILFKKAFQFLMGIRVAVLHGLEPVQTVSDGMRARVSRQSGLYAFMDAILDKEESPEVYEAFHAESQTEP